LLLKFFEIEARFPRHAGDIPRSAVDYVAGQVNVDPDRGADYEWAGRTIEHHRAQIRQALGFREPTGADEDQFARWLAEEVCGVELNADRCREALLARCRAERIEPPGPSRIERILGTAQATFERRFTTRTVGRLPAATVDGLNALITETDEGNDEEDDGDPAGSLAELKADPGRLGLDTMLKEIAKLGRVRTLGLPADLFEGSSERLVDQWRARATRLYPSDLRARPNRSG